MTGGINTSGLNGQIQRSLARTSKTVPEIVNQRSLNVAGRAMNETPRADKEKIVREVGEVARRLRTTKSGRLVRGGKIFAGSSSKAGVPLAALIINKRRANKGLKGLQGKEMEKAMVKMVAGRKRSVGFEASAWIQSQKDLASRLKKPFRIGRTRGIAVYGRPKGEARPATNSFNTSATIVNNAKEIQKVGTPALQKGIQVEEQEIIKHLLEKDMKEVFDAFNAESKR